jgi:hypothetical protein
LVELSEVLTIAGESRCLGDPDCPPTERVLHAKAEKGISKAEKGISTLKAEKGISTLSEVVIKMTPCVSAYRKESSGVLRARLVNVAMPLMLIGDPSPLKFRRDVTLVELLVLVGVIAVLIELLG